MTINGEVWRQFPTYTSRALSIDIDPARVDSVRTIIGEYREQATQYLHSTMGSLGLLKPRVKRVSLGVLGGREATIEHVPVPNDYLNAPYVHQNADGSVFAIYAPAVIDSKGSREVEPGTHGAERRGDKWFLFETNQIVHGVELARLTSNGGLFSNVTINAHDRLLVDPANLLERILTESGQAALTR